jgi:hypothetical protein
VGEPEEETFERVQAQVLGGGPSRDSGFAL